MQCIGCALTGYGFCSPQAAPSKSRTVEPNGHRDQKASTKKKNGKAAK
jgi:hypothetical protein